MIMSRTKASSTPRYRIEVFYSAEDEGYIARLVEIPSLSAFGETDEEALRELRAAIDNWIQCLRSKGEKPPEPLDTRKYSGEFRLRVPKGLHRTLAVEASREGVSLNTYCVSVLSRVNAVENGQTRRRKKVAQR